MLINKLSVFFIVALRKTFMRNISEIIIHCSDTPYGKDYSVKDIDRWHIERGFSGIGYHYVVHLDGSVSLGRPLELQGAHCFGHNANSVGICYIGGRDVSGRVADTRTPAQKEALKSLVGHLKRRFKGVTVHGHNEFSNKSCPCFDVSKEVWKS